MQEAAGRGRQSCEVGLPVMAMTRRVEAEPATPGDDSPRPSTCSSSGPSDSDRSGPSVGELGRGAPGQEGGSGNSTSPSCSVTSGSLFWDSSARLSSSAKATSSGDAGSAALGIAGVAALGVAGSAALGVAGVAALDVADVAALGGAGQATQCGVGQGRSSPSIEQELPQASLSCGDGGFGPRAAAEGDEETSPEAEPTLSLVSEARKGGEEPERAEGGALKADPLPAVQRGQETGPRPSIEGPVPVTEGAQEEPLKQLLPRASLSGGGEGSGPCAAVGGETEAVPVTDAEAGEGPERVYPLSLGEGGEGPERVDPLPSRAEGGPETVPRTSKEGPRAGKTRPSGSAAYAERPSAPPKSRVQTVPARVPPPISPAASPGGGALGESVKIKIRRNALTHQRECVVLLHREGGGGEPEEREEDSESACSVGSESLSAPSPDIPAADLLEFLEATVHRRDKVQLALDKWGDFQRILTSVRSFLRASHANKTSGSNVHIRARKLHDQLVSFGRTQDLP
ncbi:UNVERIFIED_CONTAM: hypothetical protein FKN15_030779 [Acipenser sinensis]